MKYEAKSRPASEAQADVLRLWGQRQGGGDDALFRWGYLTNPIGVAECFLLSAIDAEKSTVVGSVAASARRVDVDGRTLSAALLGDFLVDKSHRTFFPALVLQKAVLAWGRKQRDLLYGFPNELSKPLIKKLGFRELAHLHRHVLVLRHGSYIAARVKNRALGRILAVPVDAARRFVYPGIDRRSRRGLVLERVDAFDERFDRLFRERAFRHLAMGHRDRKLLEWRFFERPNEPCSVVAIRAADSRDLRAYAVLSVKNDVAHVRDLLGIDVESMMDVLVCASRALRRQGCASISYLCAAPPELAEHLASIGFRVRDGDHGPRTLFGLASDALTSSTEPSILKRLEHWYATEADEDQ